MLSAYLYAMEVISYIIEFDEGLMNIREGRGVDWVNMVLIKHVTNSLTVG